MYTWLLGRMNLSSLSEGFIGPENKNQKNAIMEKKHCAKIFVGFCQLFLVLWQIIKQYTQLSRTSRTYWTNFHKHILQ